MTTHPTFVVGVGQAGIRVMNTLSEVAEENGDKKRYDFVALDTDSEMLRQSPDGAVRLKLDYNPDLVDEDLETYPYLTEELLKSLNTEGTFRRRPIGRYKLDSLGSNTYSDIYDTLLERAQSHCESQIEAISPGRGSFNMYFIHSMGGGTGSGTFPLLAAMLDEMATILEQEMNGVETYLAGVGVVPLLTFDPALVTPPGDQRYFVNAYAALSDLDKLEELEQMAESRTLQVYAQTLSSASNPTSASSKSRFDLTEPPFDNYWLFGADESKVQNEIAPPTGGESYIRRSNQTIARSLHAVSKLKQSAAHWTISDPYIGSFDQSEVRVPHDEVADYYEMRSQRLEKQRRVEETIPTELDELQLRKSRLETLKKEFSECAISNAALRETVQKRIDDAFPTGAAIVENTTVEDVERTLDAIDADHDSKGIIVATSLLQDRLSEDGGLPSVQTDYQDTVTELWSRYDMSTRTEYTESAHTIQDKSGTVREFLHDNIEQYTDILEDWDPGTVGKVQDVLPPYGPFESDREEAERALAELRDALNELERVRCEFERATRIRQAVKERRRSAYGRIDKRLKETNEQITELQTKQDEIEREIDQLHASIAAVRNSLSSESTTKRLTVLPIETDALDEIEPQNAEDVLTSISAYLEEGLITRKKLRLAINQSVEFCDAEANRRVTDVNFDFDEHRNPYFSARKGTWLLYHEDNEEFKNDISRNVTGQTKASGEQTQLDFLSDPYRIEFISFYRRGPVPGLSIYQQLDALAEDGTLDSFVWQHAADHRRAFAYPEWYSREIRDWGSDSVVVERPPEMDPSRVRKPDLSANEVKNWVESNGLDSYVWNGVLMDNYDGGETNDFSGWKQVLSAWSVSFAQLSKSAPPADLKQQWFEGESDWENLLDAYVTELREQTSIEITLDGE